MAADGDAEKINFVEFITASCPGKDDNDSAKWQAHFERVANLLLLECTLVVGNKSRFVLNEIEFYYQGAPHPDPFTHAAEQQKTCGQWYFHRQGASYRSGSFKGLDLTFNLPYSDHAGGVLLRGIVPEDQCGKGAAAEKKAAVQGSCLVVEKLLSVTGAGDIPTLVDKHMKGVLDATDTSSPLHIVRSAAPRPWKLYRSGRVGLFLKTKAAPMSEQEKYVCRPYRFVTLPHTIAKGRGLLYAGIDMFESNEQAQARLNGTRALILRLQESLSKVKQVLDKPDARARLLESLKFKSLDDYEALQLFVLLNSP